MSSAKPVLYSYWRSSCSWRVRIVLAIKNIDCDYKAVHLVKGEQKDSAYMKKNPSGAVPTLEIDGETMIESMAIMNYLEETRPDNPIFPKDPKLRVQVRTISEMIACGIQSVQNLRVLQRVSAGGMDKIEWGHDTIRAGFEALEQVMMLTSGDYCVGDTFTMADACLVPQVYNANRFKVDMTKFPLITKVWKKCLEHRAVIAADPSRQPDTPEEEKASK